MSYFITSQMSGQFSLTPTKGTLPVLYVFLARSGKVIHDAQVVRLLENGDIVEGEKALDPATGGTKGAKIVFSSPGGPNQTLYYFQANVANGSFAKTGLDALFTKLGDGDALVKSASYLLHGTPFSDVRNSLLNHASAILQDDTGVPYRMYGAGWTVKPFGHYSRPIPVFRYAWQGDLAKLFQRGVARGAAFRHQLSLATEQSSLDTGDQEGNQGRGGTGGARRERRGCGAARRRADVSGPLIGPRRRGSASGGRKRTDRPWPRPTATLFPHVGSSPPRIALVTGASRGVGRALALELAREGRACRGARAHDGRARSAR